MTFRPISLALSSLLLVGLAGCAMLDGGPGVGSAGDEASLMRQPVFLQPIFELEGLDQLPDNIRLDELHLGVGAIFLDNVDSEDGMAYANQTPFQLHFFIQDGQIVVEAPPMTLPQGGRYQVSVQIEPQALELDNTIRAASLEGDSEESSLLVSGRVTEDDGDKEPAPLPWRPTSLEDAGGLQEDAKVISFSYRSARTVRFTIDDVLLEGGRRNELVLQLQLAEWVTETVSPALSQALGDRTEIADQRLDQDISLTEHTDEGGMDGLIGGMDAEVR
jgi:hypothetical protein